MKNNYLGFLFVMCMVVFTACGGGNSPYDNPFGDLSENPPSSNLVGDWTITAEITEITTNDGDLCTASDAAVGDTASVDISISETDCTMDESDSEDFTYSCQAADGTVIVSMTGFTEDADIGCAYVSETVINAAMVEDGTWSGTFSSRLIASGNCPSELPEGLCEVTGTITVEETTATATVDDIAPTDVDLDGYDSDSDCDDTDATIYPGASETLDDGIDQDCDGSDSVTTVTTCTEGDATCDYDTDGDGLCDNETLCASELASGAESCTCPNIDPDLDFANDWYWVDYLNRSADLAYTAPVMIVPRTFMDGTIDPSTGLIFVYGIEESFLSDQTYIYTACAGSSGPMIGICVER